MIRRALLRVAAIAALVVAVTGFGVSAPAQAADKPIGVSLDGVTYTDHLPTSLFADAVIVPGGTVTRTFWVKNRASDAGHLALAVQDIAGGDGALVGALSLRASANSQGGWNVPFPSVNPCKSLMSGMALGPGEEVEVDVTLKLSASLTHLTSQASVGNFNVRVVMASADVSAPDGCAPTTPPNGGGGASTPPAGEIDTELISGSADGSAIPTLSNGPLSGLGGEGAVNDITVKPNTGRFFQEFDVVWWLVALLAGGIFAWYRRRNDNLEEAY